MVEGCVPYSWKMIQDVIFQIPVITLRLLGVASLCCTDNNAPFAFHLTF